MASVEFPICSWCGDTTRVAWKCQMCGFYSCEFCLVEITQAGRCTHKAYQPAPSDGWDDDTND